MLSSVLGTSLEKLLTSKNPIFNYKYKIQGWGHGSSARVPD
jgi:hypothetical protein